MKKISKFFKTLDVFSIPINLKYQNKNTFTTSFGGIVSLFIFIVSIIITIYLTVNIAGKRTQNIIISTRSYTDSPPFTITSNESEYTPSDVSSSKLFFVAFGIKDRRNGELVSLDNIKKHFYYEISYINQPRDPLTREMLKRITTDLVLSQCSSQGVIIPENSRDIYPLDKYLCIETSSSNLKLQGEFNSLIFEYIRFRLYPCNVSSNKLIQLCKVIDDTTLKLNDNYNIEVLYSGYEFNQDITGNNLPAVHDIRKQSFSVSRDYSDVINFYVSVDQISSQEEIFTGTNQPYVYYLSAVRNYEIISSQYSGYYNSIVIRSSKQYTNYYRTYSTILDLIAIIGGFFQVLFLFGTFFVIPINYKAMIMEMSNRLFNLIDPSMTNFIEKEEKYKRYMEKHSLGINQPVISSLNKSKLEAEISINLYKYERNKGLKISIINIFGSIFSYFLSCCLKKLKRLKIIERKMSGDNSEISDKLKGDAKDLNINLIFDEAERRINYLLEAKTVFRFIREIDSIKSCLFKDKTHLLELGHKKLVHLDNIDSIVDKLIDEGIVSNYYNSEELALLKNNKLIEGLRGMKNKPVLHPKFDLNLLCLLQFDDDEHSNGRGTNSQYYLGSYFLNQRQEIERHIDLKKSEVKDFYEFRD